MDIFERASRCVLRFQTTKGIITAEDLWQLPLTSVRGAMNLDDIARFYHRALKSDDNVSFVDRPATTPADDTNQLRFDIVKHVINTRQEENKTARAVMENQEKKKRLLEIIATKQDKELEGKSLDELKALVAAL